MRKVYADTNLFIYYYRDETKGFRPWGHFCFEFFSRGWNCEFDLVVSDHLEEELRRHLSEKQINELFGYFKEKNKLHYVYASEDDRAKAKKLSRQANDALHVILAVKAGCDKVVSADIKHFASFSSMIDIARPENI